MDTPTPDQNANAAYTPSGTTPTWIAFGLVSASYFVALLGLAAYCLVLP